MGIKYYLIKFGTIYILIWYHKFYSSANYMVSSLIITKQCRLFLFSVVVVLEEGCFASLVNSVTSFAIKCVHSGFSMYSLLFYQSFNSRKHYKLYLRRNGLKYSRI